MNKFSNGMTEEIVMRELTSNEIEVVNGGAPYWCPVPLPESYGPIISDQCDWTDKDPLPLPWPIPAGS